MTRRDTKLIRHGILTRWQVRSKLIICCEFPVYMHQVVERRLHKMVGKEDDPFLLNVSTSILIGYRKRFLNTAYGKYARKYGKYTLRIKP